MSIYLFWIQSLVILLVLYLGLKPLKSKLDSYVNRHKELTKDNSQDISTMRYFLIPLYWIMFLVIYLLLVKVFKTLVFGHDEFSRSNFRFYTQDLIILIVLSWFILPWRRQIKEFIAQSVRESRHTTEEIKVMKRLFMPFYWFFFIVLFSVIANVFIGITFGYGQVD